jgi:hypothetical protein
MLRSTAADAALSGLVIPTPRAAEHLARIAQARAAASLA